MIQSKNTSVLVIGLDGATWKTLKPLLKQNKLPTLAKLIKTGNYGISESTLPPLTPSVWTSFLTGVNPGKHGIFGFLKYRNKSKDRKLYKNSDIKYWTLDEYLRKYRKSSYISYSNLDGLIEEAGVETKTITIDELINRSQYIAVDKFTYRVSNNFI